MGASTSLDEVVPIKNPILKPSVAAEKNLVLLSEMSTLIVT